MSSNTKVLCLPYHNIGGHFIDWSLHYVCGQTETDGRDHCNQYQNWHSHKCVKALGKEQLIQKLQHHSCSEGFDTIYYTSRISSEVAEQNFDVRFEDADPDQIKAIETAITDDYCQGIKHCQQHAIIPAFFDYVPGDFCTMYYNDRYPLLWNGEPVTRDQSLDRYLQVFFEQSSKQFANTTWDRRELAALTYRPRGPLTDNIDDLIDRSRPHLYYTNDDVWNSLDRCVVEICDVWGLRIAAGKLDAWREIYDYWRQVHDAAFARHLPRIMDAIVNDKYVSLRRFQLNFFMEVIIQHELITKHNLNLKTWQLEKFPDNTQDLHKLLEPNFHQL